MKGRTRVLFWLTFSVLGIVYGLVFLVMPFIVTWIDPWIVRLLGVFLSGLSIWFYTNIVYGDCG